MGNRAVLGIVIGSGIVDTTGNDVLGGGKYVYGGCFGNLQSCLCFD